MDLMQNKLTRAEWETIEVPVSPEEKKVLLLVKNGYNNIDIHTNENQSMFSFVKIEKNESSEYTLYKKYFEELIVDMINKYGGKETIEIDVTKICSKVKQKNMKPADKIRLNHFDEKIKQNKKSIFEYKLLKLTGELLKHIYNKKMGYAFYLYTILQLKKATIENNNIYVMNVVNKIVQFAVSITKTNEIIRNAYDFIEKNEDLLKYEDMLLFPHQKEIFSICKSNPELPKLILYTAPTGTGKTISPLGISEQYRVIFVCVARHIGLALAKSAISIEKKVAFAFGCETASDIRLHYYSALNYTKNKKSGGIGKVDNSVGDNVEIMICDVKSYITAMHYMLAFHSSDEIITYWDEPTITLDYEEHSLHETIRKNWKENKIPKFILSCATLPMQEELYEVFDDFRERFDGAEIHIITSFDCKKSIPIIDKAGFCVLPHYLYEDYDTMTKAVQYCKNNKTILRYFDLREIVHFVDYVNEKSYLDSSYEIDQFFEGDIQKITMKSLKEYYLDVLLNIPQDKWRLVFQYMKSMRKTKFGSSSTNSGIYKTKSLDTSSGIPTGSIVGNVTVALGGMPISKTMSVSAAPPDNSNVETSGILLTTNDAYTLTDGPTIFLTENVYKVGKFYKQKSNIAAGVFNNILGKIDLNDKLVKKIDELENLISAKETKIDDSGKDTDVRQSGRLSNESEKWMAEINKLRGEIKSVSLDPMYVPNTRQHQQIWTPDKEVHDNAFVTNIGEEITEEIMRLNIESELKILLLLGIGLFVENANVKYMEIMKKLAEQQRLFIIIASSDYIYGTNYQFCHGFIGKDLTQMTQQKTMQAMGRIGRNNIQQDYTIRFRDDNMISQLFRRPETNMEAKNMSNLWGGRVVV
jgi:hypothetical protein